MKTIGFIGLGVMGSPMAANLIGNGFSVSVYNRTAHKADDLIASGADRAATPLEAAHRADVIVTMLANDEALLDVVYGEYGIIHGLRPGMTVIDCSTVSPETSRDLARQLAAHGVGFLDAPVTGSKPAAEDGTLLFMVGGDKDVLEANRTIFEAMGRLVIHMGPTGSGSTAKLAHNAIAAINVIGFIEGMSIAAKAGLDPEQFLQVVLAGSANSRQAELKGEKIVGRDFSTQFSLKLMLKDLLLAGDLTAHHQLPSPLLKAATAMFQIGYANGYGEDDMSAVVQCYEEWMDTRVEKLERTRSASAEQATVSSVRNQDNGGPQDGQERRKAARIRLDIKLLLSVYEWRQEGAFSGQQIEGTLSDLSESGLQIVSGYPLAPDMFVVIHFPQEAELPPIIGRIIRIVPDKSGFRYGCMLSGLPPYVRLKLEDYVRRKLEA